jgi:hypothetical protein
MVKRSTWRRLEDLEIAAGKRTPPAAPHTIRELAQAFDALARRLDALEARVARLEGRGL